MDGRNRRRYKLYLGGKKPRSTRYYQKKKREKQAAALQSFTVQSLQEVTPSEEEQIEISAIPRGPVDSSGTPSDSSTDDEVTSRPEQPPKRMRKRKVKSLSDRQYELNTYSGSSDDPPSSASENEVSNSPVHFEPQPAVREVPLLESNICDAESSDDCHENIPRDRNGEESVPLCNCTEATAGDVMFMTLSLGLRHGLSWDAQVDILKMIGTVFGGKGVPLSKATYIKKLNAMKDNDIEYHVYCDVCNTYMGKREACERFCSECTIVYDNRADSEYIENCHVCHIPLQERQVNIKEKRCSNDSCTNMVNFASTDNSFVSVSIESQLQKFLMDEKFVNNVMKYRFNRQYIPGVYSDIYDGAVYKKLFDNGGVLSSPFNFSYTFFTDGIPYSKSAKKTVWPIYLTINELPYEERRNYMVLAAIHCGLREPNEQWFFAPFVEQANRLSVDGFNWMHNGEKVTSLVIPLCLVADSGARHKLINMQSYHAEYGCTFCYHLTERVGVQRYLINLDKEPAADRTAASYRFDLAEVDKRKYQVQEKNRAYRGVKGACVLGSLRYFSVVESCVVDYFHCILIGVVSKHMDLILQHRHKNMWNNTKGQVSMKTVIASVDEGIKNIQSNTSVIRELRLLKDIGNWKASEFRSWLLFYCIVCLKGFLKQKHLEHLAMLSRAANFLLQKTVTHYHIETALALFKLYSVQFQEVFGENNMVYNIHLLSHIPKCVFSFGPVWGHSSFPYESKNRHILQLIKSPYHVEYQTARKFLFYQSLPLLSSTLVHMKEVLSFSDKVMNYKHLVRYDRANDTNCVLLGKPKVKPLSATDIAMLSTVLTCCTSANALFYERMYYKKKRYTTASYGAGKKNNDSYAFLECGQCVKILNIIKYPVGNRVVLFVENINILEKKVVDIPVAKFDQVLRATGSNTKVVVSVERLDSPCFPINVRNKQYVARIPYSCTIE